MVTLYDVHNKIARLGLKGRVHHDGDRTKKGSLYLFVPILKLLLLFGMYRIFGENVFGHNTQHGELYYNNTDAFLRAHLY